MLRLVAVWFPAQRGPLMGQLTGLVGQAGQLLALAPLAVMLHATSWEIVFGGIAGVLHGTGMRRPILLHGVDATVWPFVERARRERRSTRVGLEDGSTLADGSLATDNAAIVAAAVAVFRG